MHEDCRVLFEKMSEYLDGELDDGICKKIMSHLEDCSDCLKCFESLKNTVDICKRYPREKVPKEIHQRLRATLEDCLRKGTF